ncbi:hypothetical protein E4U19_004893 [Claviceps sp. Clav32 group G5]|nr:hypothetical protein E4U40_006942 [Claviceps sp. LM458 group G5]KAG6039593.1 hypothetical protein E4U19_004893 [Claviceps sp. Clav32 group G5]KAG6052217.1 hypothetical protein E4U39_002254 [Claviceps sp. Clav50 group G5]
MSEQTSGSTNDSGENYTPESPDFSNATVETARVVDLSGPRFTAAEATQLSSSGTEAQNARANIRNRSKVMHDNVEHCAADHYFVWAHERDFTCKSPYQPTPASEELEWERTTQRWLVVSLSSPSNEACTIR